MSSIQQFYGTFRCSFNRAEINFSTLYLSQAQCCCHWNSDDKYCVTIWREPISSFVYLYLNAELDFQNKTNQKLFDESRSDLFVLWRRCHTQVRSLKWSQCNNEPTLDLKTKSKSRQLFLQRQFLILSFRQKYLFINKLLTLCLLISLKRTLLISENNFIIH